MDKKKWIAIGKVVLLIMVLFGEKVDRKRGRQVGLDQQRCWVMKQMDDKSGWKNGWKNGRKKRVKKMDGKRGLEEGKTRWLGSITPLGDHRKKHYIPIEPPWTALDPPPWMARSCGGGWQNLYNTYLIEQDSYQLFGLYCVFSSMTHWKYHILDGLMSEEIKGMMAWKGF